MAIQIGQTARVKSKLSPWYGLSCTVVGFVGTLAKVVFEGKYYRDDRNNYQYQEFLIAINDLELSESNDLPPTNSIKINPTNLNKIADDLNSEEAQIGLGLLGGLFGIDNTPTSSDQNINSTFILLGC